MKINSAANVPRSSRRSSRVAGNGVQPIPAPVVPPERLPPPSSEEWVPREFEDSAILWIIVIGMAVIVVAAAFLLSTL